VRGQRGIPLRQVDDVDTSAPAENGCDGWVCPAVVVCPFAVL
jgi:hypothetical protein